MPRTRKPTDPAPETSDAIPAMPRILAINADVLAAVRDELKAVPAYETPAMRRAAAKAERAAAIQAVLAELRPGILAMHDGGWPVRKIADKINQLLDGLSVPALAVREVLIEAGKLPPAEAVQAGTE